MTTRTETDQATLAQQLRASLDLADRLGLDMVAIHLDEALSLLDDVPSAVDGTADARTAVFHG